MRALTTVPDRRVTDTVVRVPRRPAVMRRYRITQGVAARPAPPPTLG